MVNLLISISLALNLAIFPDGNEIRDLDHSKRELLPLEYYIKATPVKSTAEIQYPKEIYSLQYSEDSFYQVEKTYIENQYGGTKETQIYYKKDERYHLLSRHEFTDTNILVEPITTFNKQELEELTNHPE